MEFVTLVRSTTVYGVRTAKI